MKCSIVIPAYNEENGIGFVLDELQKILPRTELTYEIIVVEDGSTDRTSDAVRKNGVLLVKHEINRGYGASLKTGIKRARNEIILIIDADGTYSPREIPDLLRYAKRFDMVVGARIYNGFRQLDRRIGKWFLTMLADRLAHTHILDLNSGLRVFKKSMVQDIFDLLPSGFSFTTTMTLVYLKRGYSIKYVPISYRPRIGKSKIKSFKDFFKIFSLIIKNTLCARSLTLSRKSLKNV